MHRDSGGPLFRSKADGGLELIGILSQAGCVKGSAAFGSATYVDVRHHFEWLQKAFEVTAAPLPIPGSPVPECPKLGAQMTDGQAMR
jgi:hypothetical protein